MAISGWGLQPWGGGSCSNGPWGSMDSYTPNIIHVEPSCGQTNVHYAAPVIIKVSDSGGSELDLDKTRIWLNQTLVYSGEGLTINSNQANGFAAAYSSCSTFTTATDATCGNSIWTIKICGVNFSCDTEIGLSAIFYDNYGNSTIIGSGDATASTCKFKTLECNSISSVEIIDNNHFVIRFKNSMTASRDINPSLYDAASYTVTPVSGGTLSGVSVRVKSVLVEKSNTPRTVILETTPATSGAMYEFTGKRGILDVYRQNLISVGSSSIIARRTKLDSLIPNLPPMYSYSMGTDRGDDHNEVALWHILAAIAIEDEKIGGNF